MPPCLDGGTLVEVHACEAPYDRGGGSSPGVADARRKPRPQLMVDHQVLSLVVGAGTGPSQGLYSHYGGSGPGVEGGHDGQEQACGPPEAAAGHVASLRPPWVGFRQSPTPFWSP